MNPAKLLKPSGRTTFNEKQSKELLKKYNIPVVDELPATSSIQALTAAKKLGYPVVLKGIGKDIAHKTEAGLVHLHLNNDTDVMNAYDDLQSTAKDRLEGVLIQPHIHGQRELIAGLFRDPDFGAVILLGLGGVLAEAIDHVTMAIAPVDRAVALHLITQPKTKKLLSSFRGEQKAEVDVLVQVLLGLSQIAEDHPEVAEIDINPLKITPQGQIYAVDALVISKSVCQAPDHLPPVAPESIGRLFYPKSIAFVGASSKLGKWGHMLPANTIGGGFQGDVYLVNPNGGRILGRTAHRSLENIQGEIDLAVVTIPAAKVPDLIPDLRSRGIRYMVLITSGFSETDNNGKLLEKRLVSVARTAGILILGPNTMGFANPHIDLFCTGSAVSPLAGGTAIVSQSGNMGTQLLAFAERQGIGIRCFSGSGNEAMIAVEDYLEGFEFDKITRTVILYVESIKNGRRFFQSASRVSLKKPIVLLKGGQTLAGNKAAASHTGALMTDSRVFNAMCRQSGIVKVEQPMELLDLAAAFSSLPLPKGRRAAIMTLGGGWGVVTADLCQNHHLSVPDLTPEIIEQLDPMLPSYWSRANPVDLVGEQDPDVPMKAIEALAAWDGCDAVINLGILGRRIFLERLGKSALKCDPEMNREILHRLKDMLDQFERTYIEHTVHLMEKYQKPILGVHLLTDDQNQTLYRVEGSAYKGVFYETPERAVYALSKMVDYQQFLNRLDR